MDSTKRQPITGEPSSIQTPSTFTGLELLKKNVARKALHSSGKASKPTTSHLDSRSAILTELEQWASSPTPSPSIMWLHGSAGVGKTTIMHTIAEIMEGKGCLLGSFFFRRTGDRCNTTQFFIPTLAYQLALSMPETRELIERAIEDDPLIFTHKLQVQMQMLLIWPIKAALQGESSASRHGRVLVIDGLDECQGTKKQLEVLKTLYKATAELPSSIVILIASRPESHIQNKFDTVLRRASALVLNDIRSVHTDIERYYIEKFREIKQQHPLRANIPPFWPSYSAINKLVQRAAGEFMYATIAIRFISAQRKHPVKQLDIVLGATARRVENIDHVLDSLYVTVFSTYKKDDLPAVLLILGSILTTSYSPIPAPSFWDRLLGLQTGRVGRLLLGQESLFSVGHDQSTYSFKPSKKPLLSVQIYHASLRDFLFDSSRSGRFFVDRGILLEKLAKRCIYLLFTPDVDIQNYIFARISYLLNDAKLTSELHDTIQGSPAGSALTSSYSWYPSVIDPFCLQWIYPEYLTAIQKLRFEDKDNLYLTSLLPSYQGHLRQRLEPCLESEMLTFIILVYCLSEPSYTFQELVDIFFEELPVLKVELINLDREHGLNLYGCRKPTFGPAAERKVEDLWQILKANIASTISQLESNGDCYYTAARHLVRCMCKVSEFYVDDDGPRRYSKPRGWIRDLISDVLPKLLEKVDSTPTQLRMVECLQNNDISDYYQDDVRICRAILQYIIKVQQSQISHSRRGTWIRGISLALPSDSGLKRRQSQKSTTDSSRGKKVSRLLPLNLGLTRKWSQKSRSDSYEERISPYTVRY